MVIDAHAHVGFNDIISARAKELVAAMRRARVSKAMVFAGAINACPTERLLKEIAPYRGTLHAVGTVSLKDPTCRPTLAQADRWLKSGEVRALKFYVGYEHFYPADRWIRPYLKLLVKHGRPAIFHTGDLYDRVKASKLKYSHPLQVDDLAAEMPDLKIVIAHMGYPWVIDAAQVCYKNRNVYADCSGFVYGGFDARDKRNFRDAWRTFERVSCSNGRILFGSDWPISDVQPYISIVRSLAGRHRDNVLYKNAHELFKV